MANNAQMTDVTIPMIEEHVETGLSDLLGSYRSTYIPGGEQKDRLGAIHSSGSNSLFQRQALAPCWDCYSQSVR